MPVSDETRERRLNAAFVTLADTLIADYDVVDILHSLVNECAAILNVRAGGLMLADAGGALQLVASTGEGASLVEVMQLSAGEGPCVRCFETGTGVSVPDIAASGQQWPTFRDAALGQGFLSVHSVPLRLRGDTIGTMNLFGGSTGALSARDVSAAQALADVATIGILQERLASHTHLVVEQLQKALDSRVLIEQAKGVISQATGTTMDVAFAILRQYARNRNLTLRAVSQGVAGRTIDVPGLRGSPPRVSHESS